MMMRTILPMALAIAFLAPATDLVASETTVLVDILVRKGILTEAEARDVLAEVSVMNETEAAEPVQAAVDGPEAPLPSGSSSGDESVYATAYSKIATGLRISGRLQIQFAGLGTDIEGSDEDPDATRHFFLRRVYLTTAAKFGEHWSSKVTYDVASAGFDAAYLRFEPDENNRFDFGLRKVNFGYEENISSGSVSSIERSGVTRYFVETNNGRRLGGGSYRIGAFHEGRAGDFFYGAAITNPERPQNAVDAATDGDSWNSGLAFWANGGYRVKFDGGGAVVGVSLGQIDDQGGVVGAGENLTVGSVYLDADVADWRLMAELLWSDAGRSDPWGFYLQPSVFLTPDLEGVFRISYTDSDGRGIRTSDGIRSAPSGGTMNKLYEGYLGANWYLMGNNMKLQGGVVFGRSEDALDGGDARANVIGVRSQLQINF